MWGRISKYYSPFVDVISFSLLVLSVFYVISQYGRLPEEIPRHYNIAGEPDAWGGKGFLIGLLVIYGFILFQAFMINYFLIIKKDKKDMIQFVNMPFIKKEELTKRQLKLIKQNMARMMAVINLIISIMFSWILFGTIQTAMGDGDGLGTGIMMLTIIIFIVPFYYVWKTYRIANGKT
ncbi:DUF1648 domain-containing protein [Virgibacillus kimchii]